MSLRAVSIPAIPIPVPPGSLAAERVAVVVTVSEPPEDLAGMFEELAPSLRELGCPCEVIFALDASWQGVGTALSTLDRADLPVRVMAVAQAVGEAALLKLARENSDATILVSLPPYRRVVAAAIPALVRRVADGADLVLARRWPRVDSWFNRAQSRVFHLFISSFLGRGVHDIRCGVRAMRPRLLDETVIYGDFFRYLPIVAARQGFVVRELAAPQHPRDIRSRVYSPGTYLRRLLDVLALFVLLRFAEKPLRFFGSIGFISSVAGFGLLGMMFVQRLGGTSIANRPLLLLAGILVVIGIEAIALGLIGELIVYLNARYVGQTRAYRIRGEGE